MYFLGLSVFLYVCYIWYKKWYSIPDYPAFGEESENSESDNDYTNIIEYAVYQSVTNTKLYSADDKDSFISKVFELSKEHEKLLYIVHYIQKEEEYVCISRKLDIINSLPYNTVTKTLFAKTPIKARFVFEDNTFMDVTEIVNKVIGPNLNFHSDICNITSEDLFIYMYYTLDQFYIDHEYILNIEDNLGDIYSFNKTDLLTWNPLLTTK